MITYKKGNLLADEASALVNTVTMGGVMGKGIALAFKKEFHLITDVMSMPVRPV
jgi:O-acetyl-ADP-ribose deacetylase (regulator of RNase III)